MFDTRAEKFEVLDCELLAEVESVDWDEGGTGAEELDAVPGADPLLSALHTFRVVVTVIVPRNVSGAIVWLLT